MSDFVPDSADEGGPDRPMSRFDICYCLVFDDCWMMPNTLSDGPQKVKACPDFGDEAFVQ